MSDPIDEIREQFAQEAYGNNEQPGSSPQKTDDDAQREALNRELETRREKELKEHFDPLKKSPDQRMEDSDSAFQERDGEALRSDEEEAQQLLAKLRAEIASADNQVQPEGPESPEPQSKPADPKS